LILAASAVFGADVEEPKKTEKRGIFGGIGYGYGGIGHGYYGGVEHHGLGHGHVYVAPVVSHSYSSVGHYPYYSSGIHHGGYDHHYDYLH
jgi:hypothetical protein